MNGILNERDDSAWLLSPFALTRRAFLKASGLAVGLGGAYLAGYGEPIRHALAHGSSQGLPKSMVPQGLGVNVHFNPATTTDAQIKPLADAGFRFVRVDLPWDVIERVKGLYDFSNYERLLAALAARDIRALCILAYNNTLYETATSPPGTVVGPHTDEVRQAFARFAAAAVAQFTDSGIIWEIWNEPDLPRFWQPQPNPDDYMALAKGTIAAMRQVDPQATIVAPALTGLEPQYQQAWDYLERCFALGLPALVDAISVHPYRLGPPESATADYQRLRALITRYAPGGKENMPILSSEWGYSLTWVSREQQAAYFVRLYLLNLMNGLPLSIWYDWQDDGPDPTQLEQNFGLITYTGQPKMAYVAAQTLTHELSNLRFSRRVSLASADDYALLFTSGESNRYKKQVLWTAGDSHTVTLAVSGSSVTITSMLGEQHTLPATDGKLVLELTGSPQYLALKPT